MAHGMSVAGPAITMTSATNFVVFLLAAITPLNAVRTFSLTAAISVFTNYVIILFAFVAMLSLDLRRIHAGRVDVLFFKSSKFDKNVEPPKPFFSFTNFAKNVYTPFVFSRPGKIIILLSWAGFFGVCVWLTTRVGRGLYLVTVVPTTVYTYHYTKLQFSEFPIFQGQLVFDRFDHRYFQPGLFEAQGRLQNSTDNHGRQWIFQGPTNIYAISWYSNFVKNANLVHATFLLTGKTSGLMPFSSLPTSGQHALTTPNMTATQRVQLLAATPNLDPSYTFPPAFFDTYLKQYVSTVGAAYAQNLVFEDRVINRTVTESRLHSSKTSYIIVDQVAVSDFLDAITTTRDVLDKLNREVRKETVYEETGAGGNFEIPLSEKQEAGRFRAFAYGQPFYLYEQYLHIRNTLYMICGICLIAIFLGALVSLWSFKLAVLITMMMLIVQVELYGFFYVMDITLNSFSLMILVMTSGVSVDYNMQLAIAFQRESGTRERRARAALNLMFAPILNGSVTDFLGVVLLAAATYPYFEIYFFRTFTCMTVIAFFTATALLPVLLSFFGPNSYFEGSGKVIPLNGTTDIAAAL
eukprot:TRINITY_DN3338_c0_g1_i1.p1 TRINITY_DN3338_c0_g1~~TRINITY_DN3338_c0_g1_i1.p1  ORF type:complete len:579 (-),score=140.92 TRINITY_DN3338_c0_g1_i1:38-1774(-)